MVKPYQTTYARMSRRQSASPDIPMPAWIRMEEKEGEKIFGVVLDTSGSMDRNLLAKALGAIASYAQSREVRHVRVVFCDAVAYDQGVMSPDEIAGTVKVRGRGGTKLQPGIDLLDADKKFPELCQQTGDDEQGGLRFEINKRRISIQLTAPYSEERRKAASDRAKKKGITKMSE